MFVFHTAGQRCSARLVTPYRTCCALKLYLDLGLVPCTRPSCMALKPSISEGRT